MNFERLQTSGNLEDTEEIKARYSTEKSHQLRTHAEQTDYENIEKIREIVSVCVDGMQELCTSLNIDINIKNELSQLPIFSTETTDLNEARGFYSSNFDFINIKPAEVGAANSRNLIALVVHELWHSLSGVKIHYQQKGSDGRTLGAVGYSREEVSVKNGEVTNIDALRGFNEGVTEYLTEQTIRILGKEYFPIALGYTTQRESIKEIIKTISTITEENYGEKIIEGYLKKNLFLLKDIKKYFGEQGVHLITILSEKNTDDGKVEEMNRRIREFFIYGLSEEHREEIYQDILDMHKNIK